ncbi:MAG: sulfatase-like hydrolase/transferase [Pirellulaceae bacterium]|nr:sulfatase-like hydrolase/transferase [Pirellulaceae bacterium]
MIHVTNKNHFTKNLSVALALMVCTCNWAGATAVAQDRPNLVVILTDDQGWGDLSINGNTNLSTPHIDSLSREGATLENFYVCSVCAPTRAEFLTGRYHPRTGVSGVSRGEGRLNPDETTVADLFKAAGYATGAFGKWHNGTQSPLHPNDQGFDEYYGFTSGHWGHYFSPPLDHNGKKVRGKGFVVDDFTNHAIEFIQAHHDQPFFCYLPLNTPHSPMMVEDRFYDKFADKHLPMKHREPEREDILMTRAALAMCENIDWNVGRLLETIDRLKLREETIVVFFCDNGPNSYRFNGGMKGRKGSVDEGGLRSPLFIRWPGVIPAGHKSDRIAAAIDLLPTLTDLTGIARQIQTPELSPKPLDGISLKPLLTQTNPDWQSRSIFSSWKRKVSVRTQRFRLDDAGALYDIPADRGQRNDVADDFPDDAKQLRQLAAEHRTEMAQLTERYANRPFTVGYAKSTTLPARDGIEHGTIQRSAKPPNNSFFTHWTSTDDSITWDIDVIKPGNYAATVYYTCAAGNAGSTIIAAIDDGDSTSAPVTEVFDPPLYDKSKERVPKSHYFVKDFKPLTLGKFKLEKGRQTLRLKASDRKGDEVIDVHSIELFRTL